MRSRPLQNKHVTHPSFLLERVIYGGEIHVLMVLLICVADAIRTNIAAHNHITHLA